jgi:malonyl CoA-acyl carrier protein transacylase/thioesterase domain-containing protein
MFPGQGSQHIDMGSYLYKNDSTFKSIVDRCLSIIKYIAPPNLTSDDFLGLTELVNQTAITQPALFIIEYSLAQYLINLGIKPDAMIGHSIGEYVAACISGVLRLEDALQIVLIRGQLLQNLPEGKMLSILLSEEQILPYLENYNLDIAAINTKDSCVISGPSQEVSKFAKHLDDHQISYKYLNTSHAFHSRMLEPILTTFHSYLSKIRMSHPTIPYVSNLTGHWIDKHQVTAPEYWIDHLRKTVLFAKGLDCLREDKVLKNKIFLEVGPGEILTNLARKHLYKDSDNNLSFPLLRSQKSAQDEKESLLNTLGNLYAGGVNVNWFNFYANKPKRVPLPTYPFEETEYWLSVKKDNSFKKDNICEAVNSPIQSKPYSIERQNTQFNAQENCSLLQKEIMKIWQDILGINNVSLSDDFFQLGGDSLQAIQVNRKINTHFKVNITLKHVLENSKLFLLSSIIQEKLNLLESSPLKNDKLSTSLIVKLKDGKEKNPLFVIHPIDGYIFCYREMSRYMAPDQMVYGIQSPWIEEEINTSPLTTIEALADYYIRSILTLHPMEPICLFGSSFGGLIAYEIAQQLESKGRKVSLLAMADIGRPNHPLLKISDAQEALVKIIELFKGKPLTTLDYAKLSKIEKVEFLLENMNLQGLPSWQHQKTFDQVNTFCHAMINYHPKPYSGKVIFFDAAVPVLENSFLKASSTWDEFILKSSKIYKIPGNHFSMLEKSNLTSLVQLLELHIADKD